MTRTFIIQAEQAKSYLKKAQYEWALNAKYMAWLVGKSQQNCQPLTKTGVYQKLQGSILHLQLAAHTRKNDMQYCSISEPSPIRYLKLIHISVKLLSLWIYSQ